MDFSVSFDSSEKMRLFVKKRILCISCSVANEYSCWWLKGFFHCTSTLWSEKKLSLSTTETICGAKHKTTREKRPWSLWNTWIQIQNSGVHSGFKSRDNVTSTQEWTSLALDSGSQTTTAAPPPPSKPHDWQTSVRNTETRLFTGRSPFRLLAWHFLLKCKHGLQRYKRYLRGSVILHFIFS